jgi:hypothetical protein
LNVLDDISGFTNTNNTTTTTTTKEEEGNRKKTKKEPTHLYTHQNSGQQRNVSVIKPRTYN